MAKTQTMEMKTRNKHRQMFGVAKCGDKKPVANHNPQG